jgi:large-conductance mechanosensitive channel
MGGLENKILTYSCSIYIGLFITGFFNAFTRDILLPLLSPLASSEAGVSKLVIQFGSIKLNIGDVIVQLINLLIAVSVVYFTLPYLKEYVPIAGRR